MPVTSPLQMQRQHVLQSGGQPKRRRRQQLILLALGAVAVWRLFSSSHWLESAAHAALSGTRIPSLFLSENWSLAGASLTTNVSKNVLIAAHILHKNDFVEFNTPGEYLEAMRRYRMDYWRRASSLETTTLDFSVESKDLKVVVLDVDRPLFDKGMGVICTGEECPQFESCSGNYSNIKKCHVARIHDVGRAHTRIPLNCALKVGRETNGGVKDCELSCQHLNDCRDHNKYLFQVARLHNVYINNVGQTFNKTHIFHRNGCKAVLPFNVTSGAQVTVFKEVVNLAYHNGHEFYHGLIDVLPMFYMLGTTGLITGGRRRTFITQRFFQLRYYLMVQQHVLGVPPDFYHARRIQENGFMFGHRVIQPVSDHCSMPSRALWHELRSVHMIPRDGFPMFNEVWEHRIPNSTASGNVNLSIQDDWLVVLGQRYNSRRLVQHDELEALLKMLFPATRVVTFDGTLGILQAKSIFNRARLYIAVHGAGLTNVIFMPFDSVVVEIRPRDYDKACYHHLTEVCELDYYLIMGEGTKDSPTSVNMTEVEETMQYISNKMMTMTHVSVK